MLLPRKSVWKVQGSLGGHAGAGVGVLLPTQLPRERKKKAGKFRHGEWRGQPESGVDLAADPMMSELWGT